MMNNYSREFHPHGISLLQIGETTYLFIVNHNAEGNFIERFTIQGDSLLHQRSYSSNLMCCPNDVVAIDIDKFYVTNDHGSTKGFGRTLEDYGRLPYASVLYVSGEEFSTAHEGIQYANGINVSADGSRLFVAATTGRELLTFNRDASTGQLKLAHTLALKTGVDNIDVDADGDLWIAAHPKLLAFVAHSKDSLHKSPSEVLRLRPRPDKGYDVTGVYMDDGGAISGSSVAVRYKKQLFIGGVFQPRILRVALDEK
jgi:arylesterase/paraoxonase